MILSISNQKGGVGKSTFTRLVATLLFHMSFGKFKICLVDFDEQKTSKSQRDEELKNNQKLKELKEMFPNDFQNRATNLYPIYSWSYSEYMEKLGTLNDNFQFIFLDFPGKLDANQKEVLETIDKALIPVLADPDDIKSSMTYMNVCRKFNIKAAWFINQFVNTKFQKFVVNEGHDKYFKAINPDLEQLKYANDHENESLRGTLVKVNDRKETIRVAKSTVVPYDDLENNVRTMVKWLISKS